MSPDPTEKQVQGPILDESNESLDKGKNQEILSFLLSDQFPSKNPDQYLPLFTENPHYEEGIKDFQEIYQTALDKSLKLKNLPDSEEAIKGIRITREENSESEEINFYLEFDNKKELVGTLKKNSEAYKMLNWKPKDETAKSILELNSLMLKEAQLEEAGLEELTNLSSEVNAPLTNPDIPTEVYEKGKLNEKYSKDVESLSDEIRQKDFTTFQGMISSDIRKKSHIVTSIEGKTDDKEIQETTREECKRRIATYTDGIDSEGFFKINYQKVGGYDHEMGVGLGDICISPDITKLAVFIAEENRYVIAERGVAYNNRPCFKYNGSYLATFTGDKFKILDNAEISDPKEYVSKLNEQIQARNQFVEHEKKYESFAYSTSLNLNANKLNMDSLIANNESLGSKYRPFTDEEIIQKLNKYREQNDGQQILNYLNEVCTKEFSHIDPAIVKAMVRIEDGYWNPSLKYKGKKNSDATGLGQFLGGTWEGFLDWCEKNNMQNSELAKRWESYPPRREDPYAMMFAIPWLMNKYTYNRMAKHDTKEIKFKDLPIHEQAFVYYLGHHEGTPTYALRFMEEMEKNGHTTISEMESAYNANPSKYRALINKGALRRIDKYGIKDYLHVLELAARIGVLAALRKPEIVEKIKSKNLEQLKIDQQFSHEDVQTDFDEKRNHSATDYLPYRTYQFSNSLNSGAPGYPGGKGDFDVNFAMLQIENLYKSGVKTIVSLDSKKGMTAAIEKLKDEKGIQVNHIKYTTQRDYLNDNNRKIFNTVASLINSGEKFLVHCRHGAHRAPFSTCGGYIASGKVQTLKQACDSAGLELSKYKKHYPQMIAQLIEFAAENGLIIEQGYLDWLAGRQPNIKEEDYKKYGDKAYQHGWPGFEKWYESFTKKYSPKIEKKNLAESKNPQNESSFETYNPERTFIFGDSIMFGATTKKLTLPGNPNNRSKGGRAAKWIRQRFMEYLNTESQPGDKVVLNFGPANHANNTGYFAKNINNFKSEISPELYQKTLNAIKKEIDIVTAAAKEKGVQLIIATQPPLGRWIWDKKIPKNIPLEKQIKLAKTVNKFFQETSEYITSKTDGKNIKVIPFHKELIDQTNKINHAEFLTLTAKNKGNGNLHPGASYKYYQERIQEELKT